MLIMLCFHLRRTMIPVLMKISHNILMVSPGQRQEQSFMKEELHGVISNLPEGHGLGPMAVWKSEFHGLMTMFLLFSWHFGEGYTMV